ncbi:Fur family transcriptional regulator [Paenibacillus turpanensis]|uniref:Fur family transcriptional regulator n=1 Tax=Paenibacillus turpanensis TaxID=2689078 RepID=UPI0014075886|nr:Fur family transcriptional regulator [Paenibacillus turpanensis]
MDKLKLKNIRVTPQRFAVLEYLYTYPGHPTVEEIYKALVDKYPNLSVTTVYNNLRVFKKLGLVKELTFGDASRRYDAVTTEHYHVVCSICGIMHDVEFLEPQQIKEYVEQKTNFTIAQYRLELQGICPDCAKEGRQLPTG